MKSDRNIVYDIITATGLTIKREDISDEAIKILGQYGYDRWKEGNDDAIYDYNE
jgi:hypothetical protein